MNMDDRRTEKNVFLIGDKVRYSTDVDCGYGMFLMDELSGRAYVYSPPADCESVQHTLRHLNDWVMKSYVECDEVDVVYWNNGLWDVERMYDGEPITPLDVYVRQLVRVYWSIRRQFPHAKVIFAATTPVVEQEPEEVCAYRNSDIEQYNQAAREALEPLGAAYDDLYAVAKAFSADCYRTCAYFSQKGAMLLGQHVAEFIMQNL